jgi:hypothetical protein
MDADHKGGANRMFIRMIFQLHIIALNAKYRLQLISTGQVCREVKAVPNILYGANLCCIFSRYSWIFLKIERRIINRARKPALSAGILAFAFDTVNFF